MDYIILTLSAFKPLNKCKTLRLQAKQIKSLEYKSLKEQAPKTTHSRRQCKNERKTQSFDCTYRKTPPTISNIDLFLSTASNFFSFNALAICCLQPLAETLSFSYHFLSKILALRDIFKFHVMNWYIMALHSQE